MGTRSLTVFVDGESEISVLYRQYDGYPKGHGKALAEFLAGARMVNGISGNGRAFNGMSDLAVRVITHLKGDAEDAGQFYLHPGKTRDCGEEYVYYIAGKAGKPLSLKVYEAGDKEEMILFSGTPESALEWIGTLQGN